jgi:hypothetical protein
LKVWGCICALLLFLLLSVDASIGSWYTDGYQFPSYELIVLLGKMLIAFAVAWALAAHGARLAATSRTRLVFWAACLPLALDVPWRLMKAWQAPSGLAMAALVAVALLLALAVRGSFRMSGFAWRRMVVSITIIAMLFYATPWMLAKMVTPHLAWFASGHPELRTDIPYVEAFILLDELSDAESSAIVAAIRAASAQPVSHHTLSTPGLYTMEAIPSLFMGAAITDARPCLPTVVCGKSRSLDFSKIEAGRHDLSVVGFYHPYCAISGIRSCSVRYVREHRFDIQRYRCAYWRRVGFSGGGREESCREFAAAPWIQMSDEVTADLWAAPTWREGGTLFAHLPFPHPPARSATGSLLQDYQANMERATATVLEVVRRAEQVAGENIHVVVFSDHPLRAGYWCSQYWPYSTASCEAETASLVVPGIPLLEIGRQQPRYAAMQDALDVFGHATRGRLQ